MNSVLESIVHKSRKAAVYTSLFSSLFLSSANASDNDKKILRAVFSRYTGWDMPDTDWSRSSKNNRDGP